MENWGLITYRETSLLFSDRETSADAKQWIAIVVAHELAHQWFGNLVTMRWWNDLWLNEGFASWMEYRGVEHIRPDWRMMDQFFFDMIAPALDLDSLTTSHPISVDVDDPKEIEAIFDKISYKKASTLTTFRRSAKFRCLCCVPPLLIAGRIHATKDRSADCLPTFISVGQSSSVSQF